MEVAIRYLLNYKQFIVTSGVSSEVDWLNWSTLAWL